MKKRWLVAFILALLLAFVIISTVTAITPKPLSARFSKDVTTCGLWWFDKNWDLVWIEGTGSIYTQQDGGYKIKCDFKVDFNANLSREEFCAEPGFAFMCKGNGALVDNRTTCNIEDAEVHNGIVNANKNGDGMFICHVK